MGLLRSTTYADNVTIAGVLLGQPVAPVRADGTPAQPGGSMGDLFWAWDDSAYPTGVIDADDSITPDSADL